VNGIVRDGENFTLCIDTRVYSLDSIKKAAYKLAAVASAILQPKDDHTIAVLFNFEGVRKKSDPNRVIADFCNELLDQDLREIIKRETTPVRNLILAHAFSRSSLVERGDS
jgi:His-Xaa-Ser system protein HxsD